MFDRITCDSEILGGKPTVKGTRISVELILEWRGSGASRDQIVAKYPHLTAEDVSQAVGFGLSLPHNDLDLC